MTLVAFDKKVMPVCSMMCNAARERGIGELAIGDHEVKNKVATWQEPKIPHKELFAPAFLQGAGLYAKHFSGSACFI